MIQSHVAQQHIEQSLQLSLVFSRLTVKPGIQQRLSVQSRITSVSADLTPPTNYEEPEGREQHGSDTIGFLRELERG